MTSSVNFTQIPAQRYFSLDELCQIVGISSKQFAAWQRDYGHIGHGGQHYNRLDVMQVLQLKHTFAPYVDAFTHNFVAEDGEAAMDAVQVQAQLSALLQKIEGVITLSNIEV